MSPDSASLRRGGSLAAAVFLVIAAAPFVAGTSAHADTTTRYVSTTGSDTDNDCTDVTLPCMTIQHGVNEAETGDTVQVAAGTYDESVRIRTSLTLAGAGSTGSGDTKIDGGPEGDTSITVDGVDQNSGITVTASDIDVSGNTAADGVDVIGSATLMIEDSVVSTNHGDGIYLAEGAQATVQDCAVSGNTTYGIYLAENVITPSARQDGAEEGNDDPDVTVQVSTISGNDDGGVVVDGGTATLKGSTLDGNFGAGVVLTSPRAIANLTASTVSNTVPSTDLQGGTPFGSGVLNFGGSATIDDSTLFGNSGQGVLDVKTEGDPGNVTVTNSTISGTVGTSDESFAQGGIVVATQEVEAQRADAKTFPATQRAGVQRPALKSAVAVIDVQLSATIVADNTTLSDCSGAMTDNGYNLDSDGTCGLTAAGSLSDNPNAALRSLADNGGPTETLLPDKHSSAVDQIPSGSSGCEAEATDQRGDSREQPSGGNCDVGAVELAETPIVISPDSLPEGTVGVLYATTDVTATGGFAGYPYDWTLPQAGQLPPGLTLTMDEANNDLVLSGTPTQAGTFTFTLSVDDPTVKKYSVAVADPSPSSSSPAPPSSSASGANPSSSTPGAKPTAGPSGVPIASTGAEVGSLTYGGVLALLAGMLLLTAGARRRGKGRHQA